MIVDTVPDFADFSAASAIGFEQSTRTLLVPLDTLWIDTNLEIAIVARISHLGSSGENRQA
jgi:hypothetical protein